MDRRQFLAITFASGTLALAGCSSDSENPDDSDNTDGEGGTNADDTDSTSTSEPTSSTTEEPASFEARINPPDSPSIGDTIAFEVEVENTGGESGTWTGEFAITATRGPEPTAEQWQSTEIELDVPAGESEVWSTDEVPIEGPAVIYYRLGDDDAQSLEIPDSREPLIQTVNLVSEWNSFGDTVENEISEAEAGEQINISSRYWYWAENQSMEAFRQVEIYDESDERVDINIAVLEQVTESSGWGAWESYMSFYTDDWETGTYTAEVMIRDEQNQEVSDKHSVEFELV
ncbi:hypothetical protein [Haloarcula laminariae]|uniref:hypothetical protein n=1 Tax=Haloarcula laminariae TaxID=2961577 RepID=UPI002406BB49|nr:hypothetical protein [Halomicroarcula sp. FL173]